MGLHGWKLKPGESGLVVTHNNRINYSLKQLPLDVMDS